MSVFHVKHGTPYHVENSLRGIRLAHRLGYDEIDLDMCMTTDDRIVGTHWERPMIHDGFRDPYRELKPMTPVSGMKLDEVTRLRAGRIRPYRISPIERLLAECAHVGIGAVLEPKGDRRFALVATWQHLAKVADDLGADVRMYALRNVPHPGYGQTTVTAAKAAGIEGRVIR